MKFSHGNEIALGVLVRKTTLRRHLWGSCGSSGELTFSWRLIMAPPFVRDYLAAHKVGVSTEFWPLTLFLAVCGQLKYALKCSAANQSKLFLAARARRAATDSPCRSL
jgi:hypothetical protein